MRYCYGLRFGPPKVGILRTIRTAVALILMVAAPALADTVPLSYGTPTDLEGAGGILETLYGPGALTKISDAADQHWTFVDPSGGTATIVAASAGFSNTFGLITNMTWLPASGLDQATVAAPPDSTGILASPMMRTLAYVAGSFNLGILPSGYAPMGFNSAPDQNIDGMDHMVTYVQNSTGNYVLGFEDLINCGDHDFNDLVVIVSGISPVPEPASVVLLGTGVVGLSVFAWRRKARQNRGQARCFPIFQTRK